MFLLAGIPRLCFLLKWLRIYGTVPDFSRINNDQRGVAEYAALNNRMEKEQLRIPGITRAINLRAFSGTQRRLAFYRVCCHRITLVRIKSCIMALDIALPPHYTS
ncbi:MAG: hypothetical protein K8I82_13165, partial [Anaerolineae bacterium]|nr:hypothetical protein [Anaerolineae bacterium]